jgi:hypothetical protein
MQGESKAARVCWIPICAFAPHIPQRAGMSHERVWRSNLPHALTGQVEDRPPCLGDRESRIHYSAAMTDESYFLALSGLGLSLAGFAGIISALDRRGSARTPVSAWRIRSIVRGGFILMFAGPATVALYYGTNANLDLTVRLSSLLLALVNLQTAAFHEGKGPEWPSERGRRVALAILAATIAANLGNVVVGSLAYLQLLFLVQISGPASIFLNTVRDVASPGS